MRKLIRNVAIIAVVTASLVMPGSSVAVAARPVYAIDSVTVTAAGGTWPNCVQDVEVAYTAGHRVRAVQAYAWQYRCDYQYEFVFSDTPAAAGRGVATIKVQADLSLYEQWGWSAELLDPRGRRLTYGLETTPYTVTPGTCPTSGVLATYP